MLILTKTGVLVNTDKVSNIYADDGEVIAEFEDHSEILLGKYGFRCNDVIIKIGECYGAINFFRMP